MFESAELGHKVDKETYDKQAPDLRIALLKAQFDLVKAPKFPVVILIAGVDGAGKGETVNLLHEWMDPRFIHSNAMGVPSDEERERPPMWRFWRALPPKGRIGIFFGTWYSAPIVRRAYKEISNADLDQSMEEVLRFEKMLADEGALILKFWFHLSKDRQRERLKSLEKDPRTAWRVVDSDWRNFKIYNRFKKVSERALRQTNTAHAPWTIVEGEDSRYRTLTVATAILDAMRARLDGKTARPTAAAAPPPAESVDNRDIIRSLNLKQKLEKSKYEKDLEKFSGRLNLMTRDKRFKKHAVVCVFEGNDAAGKGGAIRRVTRALDTRQYRVVPIAAPTEEERAQPYLWRFWRQIPRRGQFTIYDRSWYGRVLVERVEGFCSEADWMRAYSEISDFEEQLSRHGIVVVKFWLTISKAEQLKRFKDRAATEFKKHKITDEDWRNRKRWDVYEKAVCDMVERTGTSVAPWTLVEANDKYFARVKVLETLCERIESVL
jgi:polyphosphate:AMP phosphotransferase